MQKFEILLHDSKFYHIRYVAIGARVMTTKNLNISKRAMNGALAIVTSITFHNNKVVASIIIKIVSTNIEMMLKRQTLQHKYTSKKDYYETSFPIVLAYAIIGHKAQGATINPKFLFILKNHLLQVLHMSCYQEL
jgi:ABC-type uncharacterized transport system permease subunit